MFLFFGTAKVQLWNEVPQIVAEVRQRSGEHSLQIKTEQNCAEKDDVNVAGSRETLMLV